MKSDDLTDKSFAFSIRIIALADFLVENKQFTISNQVLRSGTSIGANIPNRNRPNREKISFTNYVSRIKRRLKLNIGFNY